MGAARGGEVTVPERFGDHKGRSGRRSYGSKAIRKFGELTTETRSYCHRYSFQIPDDLC